MFFNGATGEELLALSPIPDGVPTFVIEMKDGETLYGAIKVDDAWARSVTDIPSNAYQVQVYFDTPWRYQTHWDLTSQWTPPDFETKVATKVKRYSRESNVRRRARHETGWREAGFELVETANGLMPVPEEEVELAKRAKRLAEQLEQQSAPAPAQPEQAGAASPPVETPTSSTASRLFHQWWPHALAAGIGLLLMAVVLKTLLLA